MSVRQRVLEYLDYKSLSRYKFYKMTGLSNGFLDKEGSMTTDKCMKIVDEFPDLNIDWLITGKGSMIREHSAGEVTEHAFEPVKEGNDRTIEVLVDKLVELTSENVLLKQENNQLRKGRRTSGENVSGDSYTDTFLNSSSDEELAAESSPVDPA
ncbi:MAG: hypothetical protein Q8T08_18410 [Ignavibacteria bacterium]|nr:hypothetical protein [Ignavibacteria bacterium]